MIRYLFLFVLLLLFSNSNSLSAQSVEITRFDLDEFGDDIQNIQQFAEDGNGDIWYLFSFIAFGNTFVILRYVNEQWELVEFPDCVTCKRDLKTDAQGRIWVATTEGIYRWNDNAWLKVLDDAALKISFDSQGVMAFANSDGLFFYDGSSVSPANSGGAPDQINVVNELLYDKQDKLWILLPSTLYGYSSSTGWSIPPETTGTLQIEVDSQNRLYFAGSFGSIGYIEGNEVVTNAIPNVFPSGVSFLDMTIDRDDNVWVGVQGISPGIIFYDGTNNLLIPAPQLVNDGILTNHQFTASDGSLWVASRSSTTIARVEVMVPNNLKNVVPTLAFELSPNPTSGLVQLDFDATKGPAEIILFDAQGRSVRQWEQGPGSLNLGDLAAGVYWIQLRNEEGLGLQKVIVEP